MSGISTLSSCSIAGSTASSRASSSGEQRRDVEVAHALVEHVGPGRQPRGLEEVVGQRHRLVGRDEVAGGHHPLHRLRGDEVDEQVGRLGEVGRVGRDADAGDLADRRGVVERRASASRRTRRPGTRRSSGVSDRSPTIIPSLPRANQVAGRRPGQPVGGEGQARVAQDRQHLLERGAAVVGGERQRGRLVVVVEQVAAAGEDERREPVEGRRHVEAAWCRGAAGWRTRRPPGTRRGTTAAWPRGRGWARRARARPSARSRRASVL